VALTLAYVVAALVRHDDPGLVSMAPHPMLFVGLLVAVRYGFGRGLLAVALVGVAYAVLVSSLADVPTYLHLFAPPYTTPIAVTIPATAVLGAIAQGHIKRLRLVEAMCRDLQHQHQELVAKHAELRDVNVELAGKVMGARETLPALYRFAKALNVTDLAQIYSGLCKLATEVLQAEMVSLWECRDDGLTLIARRGTALVPQSTPPGFGRELERRFDAAGVLALHDIPEAERSAHHPYLTGRIRCGHAGPVVAYLTVDRLAFERYTPETIRLFSMIVDWACTSVGNALAYHSATQPVLPDRPLPPPPPRPDDATPLPDAVAEELAAEVRALADAHALAHAAARAQTALAEPAGAAPRIGDRPPTDDDPAGIRQLFDEADRLLTARRLGAEPTQPLLLESRKNAPLAPARRPTAEPTQSLLLEPAAPAPARRPTAEPTQSLLLEPAAPAPARRPTAEPTRSLLLEPAAPAPARRPTADPTRSLLPEPAPAPARRPTADPTRSPPPGPAAPAPARRPTADPTRPVTTEPAPSRRRDSAAEDAEPRLGELMDEVAVLLSRRKTRGGTR
jgi:hypothetical protein